MAIRTAQPFNAFVGGREARQRNTLTEMDIAQAPIDNQNRNALASLNIAGAQQSLDQGAANAARGDETRALSQALAEAQHVAQNPAALSQMPPAMQQRAREQLGQSANNPQAVSQWAASMIAGISAKLGQGPAPVAVPFEQTDDYKKLQLQQQGAVSLEQQRAASAAAIERQRASSASALERQRAESAAALEKIRQAAQGKPSQNENDAATRTWRTYVTARDGLLGALGQTTTGPVLGRAPAFTAKQQTADGAVSAMAPVLKQIFRVAGEGTFTDKDQELLLKMVPTRTDEPEARKAKAQNIDKIIQEKLGLAPTAGATGGWSIEEVK